MYTAAQFLGFARAQDPAAEYRYMDLQNCPFAQFLKAQGHKTPCVSGWDYRLEFEDLVLIPIPLELLDTLHIEPNTWGALVARVETALGVAAQ